MSKYIDRAALFNSLSDAKTVEEVFAAIQAAPAEDVEPARHWIPVSWENLPEDENKVLCCTENTPRPERNCRLPAGPFERRMK